MTKRVTASEAGLKPHFKVRIVFHGAMIHVASWDEPDVGDGDEWTANWINDPDYGDSIGFIRWSAVRAITWRWSE